MGYKSQVLSKKKYAKQGQSYKRNLQSYYSQLYDQVNKRLEQEGYDKKHIEKTLLSIFSRTKIPTKTDSNRLLQLLDIDKIISLNQQSLKQNSQEIKHMRMVASIKHQNIFNQNNQRNETSRPIDDLVRLARLHMLQHMNRNRGDNDDSEDQNQHNPRIQRIQQIRIERLRNINHNNTSQNQ